MSSRNVDNVIHKTKLLCTC